MPTDWLCGTYLIVSRGDGDGSDGSDALVAVNLARVATVDERDNQVLAELAPLTDALAPRTPTYLLGGPCHQSQPLCLLELPAEAVLPTRGDVLRVPLAATADELRAPPLPTVAASDGAVADEGMADEGVADEGVADEGVIDAAAGVADATAPLADEAPAPITVEDAAVNAATEDIAAEDGGALRVVAAEPAVAAAIVSALGAERVRALVVQGCAVWSTAQLLSEISRHKWGLASAAVADLPFDAEPPSNGVAPWSADQTESSAEAPTGTTEDDASAPAADDTALLDASRAIREPALWQACWRDRRPACTAGMPGEECST